MIPQYNTILFKDIYKDLDSFMTAYKESNKWIPNKITDVSATTTYALLMSRYGNNPIANATVEQFKLKLFTTMFQFGPTWEKRLDIQDKLRDLSEEELRTGSTAIYNQAYNPAEEPTTLTKEEIPYINSQNVNKFKRSKAEAYAILLNELRTDVTEDYLVRFAKLFKTIVVPEETYLYSDGDCEE